MPKKQCTIQRSAHMKSLIMTRHNKSVLPVQPKEKSTSTMTLWNVRTVRDSGKSATAPELVSKKFKESTRQILTPKIFCSRANQEHNWYKSTMRDFKNILRFVIAPIRHPFSTGSNVLIALKGFLSSVWQKAYVPGAWPVLHMTLKLENVCFPKGRSRPQARP